MSVALGVVFPSSSLARTQDAPRRAPTSDETTRPKRPSCSSPAHSPPHEGTLLCAVFLTQAHFLKDATSGLGRCAYSHTRGSGRRSDAKLMVGRNCIAASRSSLARLCCMLPPNRARSQSSSRRMAQATTQMREASSWMASSTRELRLEMCMHVQVMCLCEAYFLGRMRPCFAMA